VDTDDLSARRFHSAGALELVRGIAHGLRPGYQLADRCWHIARDPSTEYQPPDLRHWTLEGGPQGHANSGLVKSLDPVLKAQDGARHFRLVRFRLPKLAIV